MLSRFFQLKYGLPSTLVAKSDEFHRVNKAIPRIFCTNGHYSYQSVIAEAFEPGSANADITRMPIVFITRHPCDIAVSWYHQFTKRESDAKVELINADLSNPIDRHGISLWDFVRHSEIGLAAIVDYLNAWHKRLSGLENVYRTSYEAMRLDPGPTLIRVLELYGQDFEPDQITQALEFANFENLQKLESASHFQSGGLTKQTSADTMTRKVRRGKIGGYRDDFPADQVAELDRLVESRLDPALGYVKSDSGAQLDTVK